MRKITQKILQVFLIVLLVLISLTTVSALEFAGIQVLDEIDIPENLNFSVRDTCSEEYDYYMQATAREDGCFAVYARQVNRYGTDFEKVYIDLYDSDGDFLQEISFTTPFDLAVELTKETVNIYFYKSILVYNLETQELFNYSIPDGAAVNGGVYKNLRKKEFVSGEWTYICKKTSGEYTELIRSKDDQLEVLVELPGSGINFFGDVYFPSVAIAIIGILFKELLKKRKKKTNRTKKNTDDSSLSSDEKQK